MLTAFREAFRQGRLDLVRTHGPEAFDQACTLYVCRVCGHQIMLSDAFYGRHPRGPVGEVLSQISTGWWPSRQRGPRCPSCAPPDSDRLVAVAGLYGHYLGEVGLDFHVELGPEGAVGCWRLDGRGRARGLALPADDGEFLDITGTFFDLRAGWRWLVDRHAQGGRLWAREVQPGYVIGVRRRIAGVDPAERDDPELEAVFSRHAHRRRFDCLAFLESAEAAADDLAILVDDRYPGWLGPAARSVRDGVVELFVLADSAEFLQCVADLGDRRRVEVTPVREGADEPERVRLHRAPGLCIELPFADPFLRTLHTGRTFVEGTRDFYLPYISALDEAAELIEATRALVPEGRVAVQAGTIMVVTDGAGQERRWNVLALVGRLPFRGSAGRGALSELLGLELETGRFRVAGDGLSTCGVCGRPARVGKALRPLELLGTDPRTLVGLAVGEAFVYFTVECALHSAPVEPAPGRDLSSLEVAYQAGLPQASLELLESRRLDLEGPECWLLVGFDAGSLVLEPARVRAALIAAEAPDAVPRNLYTFVADALVVAGGPLSGRRRELARAAAQEAVLARFPGRAWRLDFARAADLSMAPVGRVGLEGVE